MGSEPKSFYVGGWEVEGKKQAGELLLLYLELRSYPPLSK